MGHRRHRHPFDDDFRRRTDRDYDGIFGIFGLFFDIMGFAMSIIFKVMEAFFQVIDAFLGGTKRPKMPNTSGMGHAPHQQAHYEQVHHQEPPREQRPAPNGRKGMNVNQKNNENKGIDWNIPIFIFTVMFGAAAFAAGKVLYAAIVAAAGIFLIMTYSGIRNAAAARRKRKQEKIMMEAAKASAKAKSEENEADEVEKLIKEAFDKIFDIRRDAAQIAKKDIQDKIERLCTLAEKIIGEVRTNPENIKLVKKFFYYHLDAFGEIVKKYMRIAGFSKSSEEIESFVLEAEKSFGDIEEVFEGLCEKLVESDMLNLKAEINVMKNSG